MTQGVACSRKDYGYASWSPRKGVVMLRNPDGKQRKFALDIGAPTRYALKSPWAYDTAKAALTAEVGKPLRIALRPFEVFVADALPAQ